MPPPGCSVSNERSLARDFIASSHRDIPMLRFFLPHLTDSGVFRWSEALPRGEELTGSVCWSEVSNRFTDRGGKLPLTLQPCGGMVDANTANALRETLDGLTLTGAWWIGYADAIRHGSRWNEDSDYTLRTFDPTKLREGMQLPEFCWDDAGTFAWGGRLYPDSFIVAAEQRLYHQFSNDPRLDTVEVTPNRDVLPVSSGD